jgi:hypothetical protein
MRFQDVDVRYEFDANYAIPNHDPNYLLKVMNAVKALDVLVSCNYMGYTPETRNRMQRSCVIINYSENPPIPINDNTERCVLVKLERPKEVQAPTPVMRVSDIEKLRGYQISFRHNNGMTIKKGGRNPIRYEFC